MKNRIAVIALLAAAIVLGVFMPRYLRASQDDAGGEAVSGNIDRVEIMHFHGTRQCDTCIAVGEYAKETVNTYFAKQAESGAVEFKEVNSDLPDSAEIVRQYGAGGASLWIGIYDKDGGFSKEENTDVWFRVNDKQGYMDYLRGVIEQKLSGE